MKIGIFGGAFNPIHNGHLRLMQSFVKALKLEKLLVIPTARPPHKTDEYLASEADRLAMLRLALRAIPLAEISETEFRREGKSYTYLTLLELKEQYPHDEFYLLVGSDQYLAFQSWYRADDVLQMVTLCTMARDDGEYETLLRCKAAHANLQHSIVADFEPLEVSSTVIREKAKRGENLKGLVPPAVADYIKERGLYV